MNDFHSQKYWFFFQKFYFGKGISIELRKWNIAPKSVNPVEYFNLVVLSLLPIEYWYQPELERITYIRASRTISIYSGMMAARRRDMITLRVYYNSLQRCYGKKKKNKTLTRNSKAPIRVSAMPFLAVWLWTNRWIFPASSVRGRNEPASQGWMVWEADAAYTWKHHHLPITVNSALCSWAVLYSLPLLTPSLNFCIC